MLFYISSCCERSGKKYTPPQKFSNEKEERGGTGALTTHQNFKKSILNKTLHHTELYTKKIII